MPKAVAEWLTECLSTLTRRNISYLTWTRSWGSKKSLCWNRESNTFSGCGFKVPCCRKAWRLADEAGLWGKGASRWSVNITMCFQFGHVKPFLLGILPVTQQILHINRSLDPSLALPRSVAATYFL